MQHTKRGVLVVITGPSCSGKTTLEGLLHKLHGFQKIISHTTRAPRSGETDGVDYFFTDKAVFQGLKDMQRFAETAHFGGNWYGASASQVMSHINAGRDVAVVVEPHGREQFVRFAEQEQIDLIPVFVSGDPEVLARRFVERLLGDVAFVVGRADFAEKAERVMSSASGRMALMMTEERKWAPLEHPNEIVVLSFGAATQEKICARIRHMADDFRNTAAPVSSVVEA